MDEMEQAYARDSATQGLLRTAYLALEAITRDEHARCALAPHYEDVATARVRIAAARDRITARWN